MVLQNPDVGNEGDFPFCGGDRGISEAVGGSAGGGGCRCFYLCRTIVRLLPRFPILESEAVGIEFCEVLYGGGPRLGG